MFIELRCGLGLIKSPVYTGMSVTSAFRNGRRMGTENCACSDFFIFSGVKTFSLIAHRPFCVAKESKVKYANKDSKLFFSVFFSRFRKNINAYFIIFCKQSSSFIIHWKAFVSKGVRLNLEITTYYVIKVRYLPVLFHEREKFIVFRFINLIRPSLLK